MSLGAGEGEVTWTLLFALRDQITGVADSFQLHYLVA